MPKPLRSLKYLLSLLACIVAVSSFAQTRVISGTVTAADGSVLPGAYVLVKGSKSGTVTNESGVYKITVEESAQTLLFSFIGYTSREVPITNSSEMNVVLEEDLQTLSEIVVVGYGSQQKRDLVSSMADVDTDVLSKRQVAGLDQALQGLAAGVNVTQNSGSPGGSVQVSVRGTGTPGSSDPLYVVDGVPYGGNLGSISVNDIESISVAKDAASAAIYGADGGNGVIFVTTKRGQSGKTNISLNAYGGFQPSPKKVDLLTAQEYALVINESRRNAGLPEIFTFEEINDLGLGTDWQDEVYQNGSMQNYELAIRGGDDRTRFSVSGGYYNQEGVVISSGFERYNMRVNLDHEASDRFRMGLNSNVSRESYNSILENDEFSGTVLVGLTQSPVMGVRHEDGSFVGPTGAKGDTDIRNPVAQALTDQDESVNWDFTFNPFLEYEVIKGLNLRVSPSLSLNYGSYNSYQPEIEEDLLSITPDYLYVGKYFGRSFLLETTADYTRTFNKKHNVSFLVGFTESHSYSDVTNAQGFGFDSPQALDLDNLPATNTSASGSTLEGRGRSFLSRLNYDYDDRYFVQAVVRRDGSSNFGPGNRWGTFPAVAVGWRISGESFFQSQFVSDLKIRASWGQLGNSQIPPFGYLPLLSSGLNYVLGENQTIQPGLAPAKPANLDLKWETTETIDLGFDLEMFQSQIVMTFDVYKKTTKDLLLEKTIPVEGGYTEDPLFNGGEVENKGVELGLTYKKVKGNFSYDVSANLAYNKNEMISLDGVQAIPSTFDISGFTTNLTAEGQPISSFYGYVADGLFQNDEEVAAGVQPDAAPGDIRFKDLNNDGVLTDEDRTFIGSPHPDLIYGLSGNAKWKNFDLNVLIQGVYGNEIYNATRINLDNASDFGNKSVEVLNRWYGEGTSNYIPRVHWTDPNNNFGRSSSFFVEDGSFVRLKNVQLGYTLPFSLLEKTGLSTVRIYVSGQNLVTLTDYSGVDPEIGTLPGTGGQGTDENFRNKNIGIDIGNYPVARSFILGLNIGF